MLLGIKNTVPDLVIAPTDKLGELDLMESVAKRSIEAAVVSSAEFDIGSNYYPDLQDVASAESSSGTSPPPSAWLHQRPHAGRARPTAPHTWAGRPRSVMNTGPLFAALFASLAAWLNSRLDMVVMVTMAPRLPG